jgi:glycosyltransferase involved in cell wall biosynthesis
LIVIDDKSSDNSSSLVKQYQGKVNHFKLISLKQNGGVSHARNVGIDASNGDYLFFIDSDDYIEKDTITNLIRISKKYEADIVDIERVLWYKRGNKILTFTEQKRLTSDVVLGSPKNDIKSITLPRYITGKLYKRSVIGDIRFDENIRCYEDALFNHQIKSNYISYVYAKGIFYHYFQRPSSLINTISFNHMDYAYAGRKIKEIYDKHNYYGQDRKVINNIIIGDIIVILSMKIPGMKLGIRDKKICAAKFISLIDDLKINDMKVSYRCFLGLFKTNLFQSFYFALTKSINLVDLSFRFLAFANSYKFSDEALKKKITKLYNKIFS